MIFEVKSGSFGYEKAHILNDISFEVQNGEVMSVLGPNGVGKTTLLKCMMGFLKWNRGQTCIDGTPLQQMKSKEIWRRIAYVPQAKGAAFSYSALDMVVLGRSAHVGTFGKPGKEDVSVALQAMEEIGILHLKDKLCTKMSGGELQMVLIARALTVFPEMLVLDEPEISEEGFDLPELSVKIKDVYMPEYYRNTRRALAERRIIKDDLDPVKGDGVLCMPILWQDKVFGAACIVLGEDALTDEIEEYAQAIINHFAIAFDHQALREIQQQILMEKQKLLRL